MGVPDLKTQKPFELPLHKNHIQSYKNIYPLAVIRHFNEPVPTDQLIFRFTSHDGSGSMIASFILIRIVCQNTLNALLRMSNFVHIKAHIEGAKQRLDNADKVMGLANTSDLLKKGA